MCERIGLNQTESPATPRAQQTHRPRLARAPVAAAGIALALCALWPLASSPACQALDGQVIFRDDFNGSMQPDWTWIRQNPATWQLTPTDLRIELEYGDLWSTWTNNCRNLLIRTVPTEDYTIEVHLAASLVAHINEALVLLYANDDNYLRYGLLNLQGTIYVNHVHEVGGVPRPQGHHLYGGSDVYLSIRKQGSGATMWFSADSLTWAEHVTIASLDFAPTHVGLVAFDGSEPPSASVAYYDYFTIRSDVQSGIADVAAARARPLLMARGNPASACGPVHLDFVTHSPGRVTLWAFDTCGRLVATILDKELPAGEHTADWDWDDMRMGRSTPAGLYFVALNGGGAPASTRVLLTR